VIIHLFIFARLFIDSLYYRNGVKFCGYAIPHPTNDFFELKIIMDAEKGITSKEALVKGLQDLKESTLLMKNKFSVSITIIQFVNLK
jgi:DNA-directed RNA polymerase subunit L